MPREAAMGGGVAGAQSRGREAASNVGAVKSPQKPKHAILAGDPR